MQQLFIDSRNVCFLMPVSKVHRTMSYVERSHLLVLGSRLSRRNREGSCKSRGIHVQPQDAMQSIRNHQFYWYQLREPTANLSLRCSSARLRNVKRKDLVWLVHSPGERGVDIYCVVFKFSWKLRMIGDIVLSFEV